MSFGAGKCPFSMTEKLPDSMRFSGMAAQVNADEWNDLWRWA